MYEISKKNKVIWICKTIQNGEEKFEQFSSKIDKCFFINILIKNKNDILYEFNKNNYGILISTTVIEVGIDIDVNFIFIEDADQFGLAQIHQLRGRVGRRNHSSFCILIGKNLIKLKHIKLSSDGFSITELDSKIRGSGMLHGTLQSGFTSFKFAKTVKNNKIINLDLDDLNLQQYKIKETEIDFWYENNDNQV